MTARPPRRHNVREPGSGKFAKAASPHHGAIKSTYDSAQITKTVGMRPHQDAGVTPQASVPIEPTVPYAGSSPTGFPPLTGTF